MTTGTTATRRVTTHDGEVLDLLPDPIGAGTMKDVYITGCRRNVVAVFRNSLDFAGKERIKAIVDVHRPKILDGSGGADLAELYRWPRGTVDWDGRLGLVVPAFQPNFFFDHGSLNDDLLKIKGREKEGKWFASAHHRQSFLDPRERGRWIDYFRICIKIARAVRRLHAAGLAHSDLSYKNVLVDPLTGSACIIDIDGLVVPNKYPPDVVGTPDFIAPEVVATQELARDDPKKALPSIKTDRHALAVLIYMYLLARHPLQGRKIHDKDDSARDDALAMGERALWVEHPSDASNRVDVAHVRKTAMPWADTDLRPHTICGPLVAELFRRAFVEGLHDPAKRPTAEEWERALVLTADMLIPCHASSCEAGLYVFDNSTHPRCPLCGTHHDKVVPILNLYSSRGKGSFRPDGHRLTVFNGFSLYPWHVNRFVVPNERLDPAARKRVGYVVWHGGNWVLVNETLDSMHDVNAGKEVPRGGFVSLTEGARILLSKEDGGRLAQVQLANAS